MAGRYPDVGNVAQHPNFQQGAEAEQKNLERLQQLVVSLMPAGLSAQEKKVWNRNALELAKANRLAAKYVDGLKDICQKQAWYEDLYKDIRKNMTYEVEGRNGVQIKSRPEVAQYNTLFRDINSLRAQYGLTPATELRFSDPQGSLFDEGEFGAL